VAAAPLGGFDARETYGGAVADYEYAAQAFWQYVALRSVDLAALRPGERVLDVPCGTGSALVAAAEAVGLLGRVTGIDYAPAMVDMARRRAAASAAGSVDVRAGDMTAIVPPPEPYDAVVCALGVFFAGDMGALVRSLLALVLPGSGRLVVGVFGEDFFEPVRSVFVDAVGAVAPQLVVVEPWRRTEDEATLRRLFDGSGAGELRIRTDVDDVPLAEPADAWRLVMGSGLRHTVGLLDEASAATVRARCVGHIVAHGITRLRTTTRYAIARRPAEA
jgi:SAM-dependent methyltransferase